MQGCLKVHSFCLQKMNKINILFYGYIHFFDTTFYSNRSKLLQNDGTPTSLSIQYVFSIILVFAHVKKIQKFLVSFGLFQMCFFICVLFILNSFSIENLYYHDKNNLSKWSSSYQKFIQDFYILAYSCYQFFLPIEIFRILITNVYLFFGQTI